ncbi:hypothetical protein [Pseudobacteriovorax antillogorgiicola]|uniref:Flagellar motor switch protein FliG n=1 Tax=Pseudobacteriovorax antillogorgiicola TaxID=1513793 RepID=A0A1Y6BEJ7_9BACT|nr:hypothetical protein [Pseudobacteriovorax antillogorgiicola]TCS57528.1 hypothetical protein EDD56_103268 [Pseudobacteriovorax antillogorgiicola]SMF00052.1 hypothetical protein SAMN06296036_10365 [Pseudobacteriovorax antillogorgiicola]
MIAFNKSSFLVMITAFSYCFQVLAQSEKLSEQIRSDLVKDISSLISDNEFHLIVSASSSVEREKVLQKDDQQGQRIEEPEQEELPPGLPGFGDVVEQKKPAQAKKVDYKESYTYKETTKINEILVRFLVLSSVSDETTALAKTIISEKISRIYGVKPNVQLVKTDKLFPNQKEELDTATFLKEFLNGYAGKIVLGILAFIALLIILIMISKLLKELKKLGDKSKSLSESTSNPALAEKDIFEANQEHITKILEFLTSNPLLGREFLQGLNLDQASALYAAVSTKKNRELLARNFSFMETELLKSGDKAGNESSTLASLAVEVEHFRKIHEAQSQQRFGFLSLLSGTAILDLIPEQDKFSNLAVAFKYLNGSQTADILATLSNDEKAKLIQGMGAKRDDATINRVEGALKAAYEQSRLSAHETSKNEINQIKEILNADLNAKETLASLEAGGMKIPAALMAYKLSCRDILMLAKEELSKVLEGLENEDLVAVISKYKDISSNILDSLSPVRRQVVEGMALSFSATEDQLKQSQMNLLRSYRITSGIGE